MNAWITRILFICCIATVMTGCKFALMVTSDGDVSSSSGTRDCAGGSICEFEVTATDFSDTFTASPRAGYVFSKWQAGDGYLCANSTNPICGVSNFELADIPVVDALILTGTYFYARPIFTFVGLDTDGDGVKNHLDEDDDNDGIFDIDDLCPLDPDAYCSAGILLYDEATDGEARRFLDPEVLGELAVGTSIVRASGFWSRLLGMDSDSFLFEIADGHILTSVGWDLSDVVLNEIQSTSPSVGVNLCSGFSYCGDQPDSPSTNNLMARYFRPDNLEQPFAAFDNINSRLPFGPGLYRLDINSGGGSYLTDADFSGSWHSEVTLVVSPTPQ